MPRLEPLHCSPMLDGCCRIPIFPEKCGNSVFRRNRLRIVPDELVVDLLHTQPLFCRYVGIRERPRCLMGRFDVYPRFYRRTDGLRAREHKRKEQNEKRGGSPLAFTPVTPPAVADYHSYLIIPQNSKRKPRAPRARARPVEHGVRCSIRRTRSVASVV